eukprot:14792654-Ditylum_brightwellii.AAC.1
MKVKSANAQEWGKEEGEHKAIFCEKVIDDHGVNEVEEDAMTNRIVPSMRGSRQAFASSSSSSI